MELLPYIERGVWPGAYDAQGGEDEQYSAQLSLFIEYRQLALDARFNLSIIRPNSGAVGTKNSLNINELDVSGQAGGAS
ncbi:hypothetical protein, partial [Pseudomonas palmensis]